MRVSVIIPVFNSEATIRAAIASVIMQSYAAYEVILVDDGSDSPLSDHLKSLPPNFRIIRQQNSGAAQARNSGLAIAQGDLVAFLDSDDTWTPDRLERAVQTFEQHPEVVMVASRYKVQDRNEAPEHSGGPALDHCGRVLRMRRSRIFVAAKSISTITVTVRRKIVQEQGFDPSLATAEDRDLWIRLLLSGPCYFLEEPLATIRVRPHSLSNGNIDLDCQCMLAVTRRYAKTLGFLAFVRESALTHFKWAQGLGSGSLALQHLLISYFLWPFFLPTSGRTPTLPRLRFLISLAKRSIWERRVQKLLPAHRNSLERSPKECPRKRVQRIM